MSKVTILQGDALTVLRTLPAESVHCIVTSPPYFGLRDYGVSGQIGLEASIEEYIAALVGVFREARRVLRADGTCWINLGDSYAGSWGAQGRQGKTGELAGRTACAARQIAVAAKKEHGTGSLRNEPGLKPKDLCMIPARVALALQADGWWIRSDIVWAKPNPMPESVTDRPTKAHEYVFLLAKSERYYYDNEAIKEPASDPRGCLRFKPDRAVAMGRKARGNERAENYNTIPRSIDRNRRSVWTIATRPYSEAHFATFPPELPEVCIKAGTSEKGCCPQCGASWKRQTKSRRLVDGKEERHDAWARPDEPRRLGAEGVGHWRTTTETITTGWGPGCSCNAGPPIPCTVLDPFFGAGTTGMVAARLLRDAIGIELNPRYCKMAARRIRRDGGMFVSVSEEGERA
jgi:DNA modification methylase